MRSMETDKRKLRQRAGVKEYENHIWDVLNPHRYEKSYSLRNFLTGVSIRKDEEYFFLDLRQNIIDDVLSFQGHSFWLPSSHTAWPHQTLSEVHLKSISEEKVERLQAHLSSLTNESFANNFFSSINSRQGKDFKQYV